jgi:uncharacterized membrane-anchored protein
MRVLDASATIREDNGSHNVHSAHSTILNKVPQVTFAFWLIKICATTLGETGGDALSGKQRTMILGG